MHFSSRIGPAMVSRLSLQYNFIEQSNHLGSAQAEILLVVSQRFAMVKTSSTNKANTLLLVKQFKTTRSKKTLQYNTIKASSGFGLKVFWTN